MILLLTTFHRWTELAGLKDAASLTNLIFQIQEFEAVDPEINNLVHTFFAAFSIAPQELDYKYNAPPTELSGLEDYASLSNLFFQIQEFEALDPEINNLVYIFFAAVSDFEVLLFSLLGGLEPPILRLTAESASRLLHKSSVNCVG